jgi:hypothetical protein
MRLWSIHPKYLDRQGLLAVWREGLLAQKVLLGKTKGYKNHPQLDRFKKLDYPIWALKSYLLFIWIEAEERGYNFDQLKLYNGFYFNLIYPYIITVTTEQLDYEFKHLQKKLKVRDNLKWVNNKYNTLTKEAESHPLFAVVEGKIEDWEKINGTESRRIF